jgi:phosphate transport system substrate-binding protein
VRNKLFKSAAAIVAASAVLLAVGVVPAFAKTNAIFNNSLNIKTAVGSDTPLVYGGSSFDQPFVQAAITQYDGSQNTSGNNVGWLASAYASHNSLWGRELAMGDSTDNSSAPTGGNGAIGFSDIPLNQELNVTPLDSSLYQNGETVANFIQLPVALGGIGIIYHITFSSGANAACQTTLTAKGLRLDGATLGGIFAGTITSWNNAAIEALNPKLTLNTGTKKAPKVYQCLANLTTETITNEVRTNGSGTTYMFTSYLNKADSTAWPAPTSVMPVGSTNSNSGALATAVTNTDGSIGYVEAAYALINSLPTALIKNASGKFVKVNTAGITKCAAVALSSSGSIGSVANFDPTKVSGYVIANQVGKAVYPISGFSWAIIQKHQSDQDQAIAIAKFLEFLTHGGSTGGQSQAAANDFAPLPGSISAYAQTALGNLTYGASNTAALSATN